MPIFPKRRLNALIAALCTAVAAATLAACGFRLAGREPLAPVLARPYVSLKDPYTDFSREFERQLRSSGAAIQPDSATASAEIDISKDTIEQRILSVSARNIPTQYLLVYTVTYGVNAAGKELLAPQTVSLSQDYTFSEQAVLAKEHEADILREQMARNLVAIVMRRLSSLK
jgi:outer membrane lipopolysaccharide assembly protein LptE/RlpB